MRRSRINSAHLLATLACLPLAGWSADASDADAPEESPGNRNSGWSATVEHDESKRQAEETSETMRLRVYDDLGRLPGDDYPGDRLRPGIAPGIAVDVEAEFVTCPDGHTRVERINVGGRNFDIDSECDQAGHAGKITIEHGTVGPDARAPESDERSSGELADE